MEVRSPNSSCNYVINVINIIMYRDISHKLKQTTCHGKGVDIKCFSLLLSY